jgi:Omp85 superfamily domain
MPRVPSCVVLLLALAAAPAAAQDQNEEPSQSSPTSRAAALDAARDDKAAESVPPTPSKVERALYRYDNSGTALPFVFQPWHGFHLAGANFPAGAGTKIGVGFTHDLGRVRPAADPDRPNRIEVDAVGAYSTLGYSRAAANLNVYRPFGAPVEFSVGAQHYEFPQQDFFGFGQNSWENNRTDYLLRSTDGNVAVRWHATKQVDVAGGVSYLKPTIGGGTDDRFPSTDQLFNPATIPGYQRQPDFVRSDGSVAFDWRDNPLHSHAGGRYGVQFSDYRDQDFGAFDFRSVSIDLQQYVPIPDRYRTIALHAAANFTDPRAGQQVPFYFQPTLGGAQALRGFREFRFQDRDSVLVTAEYRWEAWWALDGALFVDAGQVAARRRDFVLRDFDVSYGVGFRIHSNSAFVARLDLAFSREGFIPLLRFEHAF